MPKDYDRTERVASNIQRILSSLIRSEVKDPRVNGLITINDVVISKDLAHAKVYVSVLKSESDIQEVVDALNGAKGYLHNCLGQKLNLRIVPKLQFFHDTLLQEANRIEKLIDQVMEDEKQGDKDNESHD